MDEEGFEKIKTIRILDGELSRILDGKLSPRQLLRWDLPSYGYFMVDIENIIVEINGEEYCLKKRKTK
jgi:hypothetical protein